MGSEEAYLTPQSPTPTLAEQVVTVELAYYRQLDQCVVTEADLATWYTKEALPHALPTPLTGYPRYAFARHVLERHRYSLHAYMARHLKPEAWSYWLLQGGLVAPFR